MKKSISIFTLLLCTAGAHAQTGCNATLWDHIYHKDRLQVIEDCITVTGTIHKFRAEKDGDIHIQVKLDKGYKHLMNKKNRSSQDGCLVVEPICKGTVTQADAHDACHDYKQPIKVPADGTHVRIKGAYVLDAEHGWKEIHPVTSMEEIQ